VRAFAPASVSNMGPGFDILGCAVDGAMDSVLAVRTDSGRVTVSDAGHAELPSDAHLHSSGIAASEVLRRARTSGIGVDLRVTKGIPLSGGQGGSAASAVAGAVAVNALIGQPLDESELLQACLAAEETVAGRHADNLAASLLGGIVLVRSMEPLDIIRLPVPAELRVVLVHPDQRMKTREGRAVVPQSFSRETLVYQAAQVGALVAGLTLNDYEMIARALDDRVAEPYRAALLPGFIAAKAAALRSGALGASISGSGPTSFALVKGDDTALTVAESMADAYRSHGIGCDARVSRIRSGAWLEDDAGNAAAYASTVSGGY
jgi:homoserine kinase